MSFKPRPSTFVGDDGLRRCFWCKGHDDYIRYHDTEWGAPVRDDTRLFEKLCLEGFQAGLSWLTILRKRDAFRRAFHGFDIDRVARMGPRDVERLVLEPAIVRHRGKIESVLNNAKRAQAIRAEFGSLAEYVWQYRPADRPRHIDFRTLMVMTTSPESIAMSKDLKRRGWSFVGPTTVYAFMQAMGLVNDHVSECEVRPIVITSDAG